MSYPSHTTRSTTRTARKTKAAVVIASTGILAAGVGYMATANAQPAGCTASSLSNALGTVASETGGWLSGIPGRGSDQHGQ